MKLVSLPKGSKILDTSARVTAAMAKRIVALDYPALWRSLGHSPGFEPDNFSAEEAAAYAGAGLGLAGLYDLFPHPEEITAAGGASRGARALAQARAAGAPAGLPLSADFEGPPSTSADTWLDFARAEFGAWLAAEYERWGYDGLGEATALSTERKDALLVTRWWDPGAAGAHHPSAGYALRQVERDVELPGLPGRWDVDEVLVDGLVMAVADDDPRPAVATSPPATPRPPTPPALFRFQLRAGESVGDRHARVWEEALAGGHMGHTIRGAWYASFIDYGQGAQKLEAWSTSCAIAQHASLSWAGDALPSSHNGWGIFEEVGATEGHPAWQKNDGHAAPARGDVVFWQTADTNNGHVGCVVQRMPDGAWLIAAGGGGADGTVCGFSALKSDAHGCPLDPYGRPLQGWWRVELLGLPASPPVTVEKGEGIPPEPPTSPATPNALAAPTLPPPGAPAAPTRDTTSPASRVPWGAFLARAATLLSTAATAASSWGHAHPTELRAVLALAVLALLAVEAWRHRARVAAVLRGAS